MQRKRPNGNVSSRSKRSVPPPRQPQQLKIRMMLQARHRVNQVYFCFTFQRLSHLLSGQLVYLIDLDSTIQLLTLQAEANPIGVQNTRTLHVHKETHTHHIQTKNLFTTHKFIQNLDKFTRLRKYLYLIFSCCSPPHFVETNFVANTQTNSFRFYNHGTHKTRITFMWPRTTFQNATKFQLQTFGTQPKNTHQIPPTEISLFNWEQLLWQLPRQSLKDQVPPNQVYFQNVALALLAAKSLHLFRFTHTQCFILRLFGFFIWLTHAHMIFRFIRTFVSAHTCICIVNLFHHSSCAHRDSRGRMESRMNSSHSLFFG